jgi:hypothetical protein
MSFTHATSRGKLVRQSGVASVALVVMLLIMVSVAAITLSRMASTGLSESVNTNLLGAVLAATDSGLERSGYRLANGIACTMVANGENWETVGPATSQTAQYQVTNGLALANGRCQVQVTGRNGPNGRVLRTVNGEFVTPYTEHFPPTATGDWPVSVTSPAPAPPAAPPADIGITAGFNDAPASSGRALVGRTPGGLITHQLTFTSTRILDAPFDVATGMTIPVSFSWQKLNGVAGVTQFISIELLTTTGTPLLVWSDPTEANMAGWQPETRPVAVPLALNGQRIDRIRLSFDLNENGVANRISGAFDRIRIGGLVAWQETAN